MKTIRINGKRYKPGCHADGGFGHGHVRDMLASLLDSVCGMGAGEWSDMHQGAYDELLGETSDDAGEEVEVEVALVLLNRHVQGGCFELVDGDLMLVAEGEEP